MTKILAIGDIHGDFENFQKLFDKLGDYDLYIFLGDYIDRGSDSFNVIEFLIQFSKSKKCIFLEGNHEKFLLNYIRSGNLIPYAKYGGLHTIKSYLQKTVVTGDIYDKFKNAFPKTHLDFFNKLLPEYQEENYIFIHNINSLAVLDETQIYIHGHSSSQHHTKALTRCLDNEIQDGKLTIIAYDVKKDIFITS